MKSFLLVFFICFVQMCMSAPTLNEIDDDSLERFDIEEIEKLHTQLKAIPGINQPVVENFMNVLKKFTENSTEPEIMEGIMGLVNIVLNKDVAEDKQVKLGILSSKNKASSSEEKGDKSKTEDNDSSEEITITLSGEPLDVDDSKELDNQLSSKLNESQKAKVLEFFTKIGTNETKEIENVMSDFLEEALKAMFGDAYILKNGKIIPKVADGNQE